MSAQKLAPSVFRRIYPQVKHGCISTGEEGKEFRCQLDCVSSSRDDPEGEKISEKFKACTGKGRILGGVMKIGGREQRNRGRERERRN